MALLEDLANTVGPELSEALVQRILEKARERLKEEVRRAMEEELERLVAEEMRAHEVKVDTWKDILRMNTVLQLVYNTKKVDLSGYGKEFKV